MSGISTGIGLASGIDIGALVDAIIGAQRTPVLRLQGRAAGLAEVQSGLKALEAFVLSIKTSTQQLGLASVVNGVKTTNSDPAQLSVAAGSAAAAGTNAFRSVRLASSHAVLSRGFANTASQAVGAGTLSFSPGGEVETSTRLDVLNGGAGVDRGTIRITDRAGNAADIDLATAYDVADILEAINGASGLGVTARARGNGLELVDASGGAGNLSVVDVGGGRTALDLGIARSVAGNSLVGDEVLRLTSDFTFDLLNDGNGVRLDADSDDVRITLTDDTAFDLDLDGAATLGDVVDAINGHADNAGKLLAEVTATGLRLTDLSGGGGTSAFAVADLGDSNAASALGLDTAPSGNVVTGRRLLAGINSVLVRSLNGGNGIGSPGSVTFTDRAGNSSTIDLSAAQSLDEVFAAINDDPTIAINARVNASGNGILLEDTSGGAGNLAVADVGPGTTAADLGLAVDAAVDRVDSGSLGRRFVAESTTLADYLPPGKTLSTGAITVTDSAGNAATIGFDINVKTIGDVLDRINNAAGIDVTARLNDTGDGIVVVDDAGGAGGFSIQSNSGVVAQRLGLDSAAVVGTDGRQRIAGRAATSIEVETGDTLDDVVKKINDAGGHVRAAVVNTGSALNPFRLRITSARTGETGRFVVEDAVGLGFANFEQGRDALLRVGSDAGSGFLVASGTNTFKNVVSNVDVTLLAPAESAATVTVARDTGKLEGQLQAFVSAYNAFVDNVAAQTRFDAETGERGVLNGQSSVLRVASRLDRLVSQRYSGIAGDVDSLTQLGVNVTTGGKLSFDAERLRTALDEDPQAVTDFFLDKTDGFAAVAKSTLDALTDPFTGTFKLEDIALGTSIESLSNRIDDLNGILEVRRERLLLRFIRMEEAIALLQSQQRALGGIRGLTVNPAPTGAA